MTPRTVQAIRHVAFEDLGSFEPALREAGYDIAYLDAADRDLGRVDALDADLLVVLGGPIGVQDRAAYPIIDVEIRLLRARLAAGAPTLGICLGAQLLAAALNADVYPGPSPEVGWSPLDLNDAGCRSVLAALRDIPVLHWHGDTFDVPPGCDLLASTRLYPNQAFSRGPNVLGLQFHPEVRGARFEHWLLGHANELAMARITPPDLRRDAARYAADLERAAQVLMRDWLAGLDRGDR